jgi:hypothetical protein
MIRRCRIQNFKSILDVAVDLSPVTVLVGRSGTGKSNFVESLRFLRDVLAPARQQPTKQVWQRVRPATVPKGPTRFEIEFSISGVEELFTYQLSIAEQGPQAPPVEESLRLGEKLLFHQRTVKERNRLVAQWVVEPELLQVPEPGQIALGRIPSISEVVIAFTALTSGLGCYIFPAQVLCGGKQQQSSIGLNDAATNYLDTLRDVVSNLQDLNVRKSMISSLRRLNPSVASVELNDIQQPTHVVVGHKFDAKTLALQLSEESDGFRRFYAHLLALYQRPPKQTLMFEHPEDGIHPGALELLADEFKAAAPDGRGQVILTTHSPRLLDHFDADQIRVVELDGFETRIGPVSREQQEAIREYLLDPGELLTVDPARIQSTASESTDA